ncbi:type I-C CRISPR-associated protein Cas7/Csd2 [Mariprofundus erugo]|uniref:Type I-C CRISPR-associated protein Cas7/Csd2 n=1 Tax=Mariprofundus erugo TaxID=2528639 RepID=A0A5R9GRD9_9PROT|nr:type I-C CRISPR-associated protein Cas7/Csd2 [Mariprofundus erugo]TLS67625.1 type I-C CRISPR-associated protein Cas7/Csd2 [Mariprofundus erugo]
MSNCIQNRYDFVLLFDVQDGNPNGDPDAGNLPRVDAETGKGLVTDVCLKRKVRNYVGLKHGEKPPYEIYVKEKAVLTNQQEKAYIALGLDPKGKDGKRKGGDDVDKARDWMCRNFFDIRTFGAVMGLKEANCGQVRGPVQITFARSVDPVVTLEHSITRMAVATEAEAEKQDGDNRTMGRKFTVPYGLYVAHGFVSASLAGQTGFSEGDLSLLWESLNNMFEHDRSAARGMMATRKLVVFKHESNMGNAPAHVLFDRVQAELKDGVTAPRSFADYDISVNSDNLPSGVTILEV